MNLLLGNKSYTVARALGSVQVLNEGEDDELECQGYRNSQLKRVLFYLSIVLSLGMILVVMRWKSQLRVYLTKTPCPLVKADTVLLKDESGTYFVETIHSFLLNDAKLESVILRQLDLSSEQTESADNDSVSMNGAVDGMSDRSHLIQSYFNESASDLQNEGGLVRIKHFDHHHVRYAWNRTSWTYDRIQGLDYAVECSALSTDYNGLTQTDQAERRKFYGENAIDIPVKSYWRLFIDEVLNPFYVFQVFSVILWSTDEYYYYAGCIVLISVVSIAISLYETKRQSVTLCEKVASKYMEVKVCRGSNNWQCTDSRDLVPGDVISLAVLSTNEIIVPCDAVVLSGNAVVNESMLTGESVPEKKSPLVCRNRTELYSATAHKRHTLFSGTKLIQTTGVKHSVLAVVLKTGFNTTKGDLVRSILFPKPISFQFYRDAIRFIICLALLAVLGMVFSIVILIIRKTHVSKIIIRTLDIITIAVPPALPAAMTVGTVYAQNRLKTAGIFCISPPRINFCGKIKLFCFDKTGTLTEDGLDMWGVVPTSDSRFSSVVRDPHDLEQGPMLSAMATCHSIVTINGQRSGDPLDVIMFNSIGWLIENTSRFEQLVDTVVTPASSDAFRDDGYTPLEIATLKEFPFSSELQRMSVITQSTWGERMEVFCKGAPERVCSLCRPQSVPPDFAEVLHKFTVQGFRVIALAWKRLKTSSRWHQVLRMSREEVETDLKFLGLVVLQNALKPETTPVIMRLTAAAIRTVMVTGDNILTAISVARKCRMVAPDDDIIQINAADPEVGSVPKITLNLAGENKRLPSDQDHVIRDGQKVVHMPTNYHFAVSGGSFGVIVNKCSKSFLAALLVRGTIFARMSPNQKQQLVEALQELGYFVGMCGDGSNDCGALKTAHAGISLSEEEASIASPFTSKVQNIECVPTLIREGRAALVTSFGCFKYMALYSMIQFMSVLILYWYQTNLSNMMFIYIDLLVTTTVAVLMGYTAAYHKLVPQRPRGSLASLSNILNILLQIAIVSLFQVVALVYMLHQPWYTPVTPDKDANDEPCYEITVIFCVSAYQYIIMAYVFSKGPPFRKRIWTNWMFFVALWVLLATTTFLLFVPPSLTGLQNFFEILPFPSTMFKVTILTLTGISFVLSFSLEYLMEDSLAMKKLLKKLRNRKVEKNKYKLVARELDSITEYPSVQYLSTCHYDL